MHQATNKRSIQRHLARRDPQNELIPSSEIQLSRKSVDSKNFFSYIPITKIFVLEIA